MILHLDFLTSGCLKIGFYRIFSISTSTAKRHQITWPFSAPVSIKAWKAPSAATRASSPLGLQSAPHTWRWLKGEVAAMVMCFVGWFLWSFTHFFGGSTFFLEYTSFYGLKCVTAKNNFWVTLDFVPQKKTMISTSDESGQIIYIICKYINVYIGHHHASKLDKNTSLFLLQPHNLHRWNWANKEITVLGHMFAHQ